VGRLPLSDRGRSLSISYASIRHHGRASAHGLKEKDRFTMQFNHTPANRFSLPLIATLSVATAFGAIGATARADEGEAHKDIWVYASNGALRTGSWDHDTGKVTGLAERVFKAEFGEDPKFPFSIDEPGIGSDLVGSTLTMNLLQGLGAWNGNGFGGANAYLLASYGGQDAFSTTGGSFSFLVTQGLDLHAEFTVFGLGDANPANGIYLAAFTFASAGLATSETFWIVFNLGLDEKDHDAAAAWVEANLVPAPGALALLALGGALLRRRR